MVCLYGLLATRVKNNLKYTRIPPCYQGGIFLLLHLRGGCFPQNDYYEDATRGRINDVFRRNSRLLPQRSGIFSRWRYDNDTSRKEVNTMPEINILEVFEKRAELQKQYEAEGKLIREKYAQVLEAYKPANEELNAIIRAFNEEWDSQINPYRKEMKALRKKYNRMLKEL